MSGLPKTDFLGIWHYSVIERCKWYRTRTGFGDRSKSFRRKNRSAAKTTSRRLRRRRRRRRRRRSWRRPPRGRSRSRRRSEPRTVSAEECLRGASAGHEAGRHLGHGSCSACSLRSCASNRICSLPTYSRAMRQGCIATPVAPSWQRRWARRKNDVTVNLPSHFLKRW